MNDRQIFRRAAREKERAMGQWNKKFRKDIEKSTCQRGCTACCYQMVGTSFFEGYLIGKYVLEKLPWIESSIYDHQVNLDKMNLGTNAWLKSLLEGCKDNFLDIYYRKHISCIFLSGNRDCLIYDVRPIACASYFSVGPPHFCSGPKGTEISAINNLDVIGEGLKIDECVLSAVCGNKTLALPMTLIDAVITGLFFIKFGIKGCEIKYLNGIDKPILASMPIL